MEPDLEFRILLPLTMFSMLMRKKVQHRVEVGAKEISTARSRSRAEPEFLVAEVAVEEISNF